MEYFVITCLCLIPVFAIAEFLDRRAARRALGKREREHFMALDDKRERWS